MWTAPNVRLLTDVLFVDPVLSAFQKKIPSALPELFTPTNPSILPSLLASIPILKAPPKPAGFESPPCRVLNEIVPSVLSAVVPLSSKAV